MDAPSLVPAGISAAQEHSAFSVFEGLSLAGVTPGMIVTFCAADADKVDAWRKGDIPAPMGRVVFLTMVLSHLVNELLRTYEEWLERDAVKGWSNEAAGRVALGTDSTGLEL